MPERTFDSNKICWFDFESRSGEDLQKAGAARYACDRDAAAIILTYAIGHNPTKLIVAPEPGRPLSWNHLPLDFTEFYHQVEVNSAAGIFAAFNAGFDRSIWNFALRDAPPLWPDMVIDPSVQATAAGLPPDLAGACKASGSTLKVENGNEYIKLFCLPDPPPTRNDTLKEFVQWARPSADRMSAPAADGLIRFLGERYPCSKHR